MKNEARVDNILHTDERLMPYKKKFKAWSSWNSISEGKVHVLTYWLNKLQNLNTSKNYFFEL